MGVMIQFLRCSCIVFGDQLMLPYSINSLSRPNEFLSALALCNLCASPLGIVAFFSLSAYLNKAAEWEL